MTQKKVAFADSAMNSKAATVQKHDTIIIKNHPEHQGQMYQVKEVKRDGSVRTPEGHIFYPEFFDLLSDWQQYNGGFGRFNQTTGELVEEQSIKQVFRDREQVFQDKDRWVSLIVLEADTGLDKHKYLKPWLAENEGILVERNPDPEDPDYEEWRLIRCVTNESPNVVKADEDKITRLHKLETEILEIKQVIINSFYEIGVRLRQIRDERLYELKNYQDFKKYVEGELSFNRAHAYRQISAAQVLDDILPVMDYVSPPGRHEKTKDLSVSPPGRHELGEKHLRPLTNESLTTDDRREIWEAVEFELEELEAEKKRKNPDAKVKLTTKIVEKAIAQHKLAKNPPIPKQFEKGQICKVKLRCNIGEKSLTPMDGKLVRVVEVFSRGVKCVGLWGEEIEDYFHPDELEPTLETDGYRQSVNLPIGILEKLSKKGQCLEDAILKVLEG